jgi:hypothetical protein
MEALRAATEGLIDSKREQGWKEIDGRAEVLA